MLKTKLFKTTFLLLAIVGALDIVAVKLYLFWSVSQFDSVVHFFAGICVGMASILFWRYGLNRTAADKSKILLVAVVGALIIGIIWETFELYFGITFLSDGINYIEDTGSDLLMDIVGGFLGGAYGFRLLTNNKE